MKKSKQILCLLLCVLMSFSTLAVTAQAATPKKYVKSISVTKKDTVTIPADKTTVTKTYKVTVKVKGSASKKFTAKSGNTAVATVKVSGTKINVTAKKAGKAKITVTTKAKGAAGKKLSKTLTLTVKKQAGYVSSLSLSKKAEIIIPAGQTSAEKTFDVTVKTVGSASKAFTAKSSNTKVATAKVSSGKLTVIAEGSGTAIITVTTKAKNDDGIKLSKTLVVTVAYEEEPEPYVPAYISEYNREIELSCSPYAETSLVSMCNIEVAEIVSSPDDNCAYFAEVKDTSVARSMYQRTVIVAEGEGTTTADIYEQDFDGNNRLLGTVDIKVEKTDIATLINNVSMYYNDPDFNFAWLKLNFGKETVDYGKSVRGLLAELPSMGVLITDKDYTITYKSENENVVTVDESGLVSGVKNGETIVSCIMKFSDSSETELYLRVQVSGNAIEKVEGYTIDNVRDYIVGVDTPIELDDGTKTPLINFDNAATTPAFKAVQEAVDNELEMYGSIGRGFSQKSNHSTDIYNSVRDKVLDFLGADPEFYTCFYVNTTTDGLNKLASALVESEDDIVLTTRIEHHANDLSWRERCKVIYAEVDEQGRVIYDDIEKLLKENKVKIVSISAASNVTGYVNDVHRVARLAHKYGAQIVVDGAQIVAHRKFSMVGDLDDPMDDIDFIAFSAHKMYSPYGGGAVVGITEILNQHMPEFYGGGTIKVVGDNWQVYKDAPAAYEAGSPNYPGVVGLGKAIDVLSTIGMDKIEEHEKVLNRKLIDGLKKLDNIILYGDCENIDDRVGVITFNFSDINTYLLAQKLSGLGGVATRRGAFCAHPYVWRLMGISDEQARSFETCTDGNTAGMVRVSFGIYNNEAEIDAFLAIMPKAMQAAKDANAMGMLEPLY